MVEKADEMEKIKSHYFLEDKYLNIKNLNEIKANSHRTKKDEMNNASIKIYVFLENLPKKRCILCSEC